MFTALTPHPRACTLHVPTLSCGRRADDPPTPGPQCQSRREAPYMPIFHILGNYTDGPGSQPRPVNDVSGVIAFKGVLHVFHQFGQCGWAHAVSWDGGAHWKNLRHPLIPDATNVYDACGCYVRQLQPTLDCCHTFVQGAI